MSPLLYIYTILEPGIETIKNGFNLFCVHPRGKMSILNKSRYNWV